MKDKNYFRKCPKCDKELGYTDERNYKKAFENNSLCISCAKLENKKSLILTRNCPKCGKLIFHTNHYNRKEAEKLGRVCKECSYCERNFKGENNPFYNKKHTDETKDLLSKINSERDYSDAQKEQARQLLKIVSNNRPLYEIWLEKFGKEVADEKIEILKEKISENNSGSKNPMYGKPAPQGSGNGWSGWYNNWYFRSLKELSFMINVIENQNLNWKVPDKNFKFSYINFDGHERTYTPDFIIDNRIIEIKPTQLHNTPSVLLKKQSTQEFCNINNYIYELIDPPTLTDFEIKELYLSGKIKFLDRYEKKFKEIYKC